MNKNRKGFTIVELVIVIAIIAILAAVLIPTFASLIAKANVSADTQLVRNLNTALTTEKAGGENNKTMNDALKMAKNAGYDIDRIVSKSGNNIGWDSKNDRFVLIDANNDTYIYPTDAGANAQKVQNAVDYFVIYKEMPTPQKYSIYLSKDATVENVEVSVGFDAGENKSVKTVKYENATKQSVIIRTNGGTLTVNGAESTVSHYEKADKVVINAVADNSFHEFGKVDVVDFAKGRFVAEAGASISFVNVTAKSASDIKGIEINKNAAVVGVTVDSSMKEDLAKVVSGAEVYTEKPTEDKVAYSTTADGVVFYTTLQEALNASGKVVLLKDVKEDLKINANVEIELDLNGKTITNAKAHTIYVSEGATLVINGDGVVDNISHAKAAIYNYGGTVTLNGGKYTRSFENGISGNNPGGNSYYNIQNYYGKMTINEGVSVTQNGHFSSMIINGWSLDKKAEMTINGGDFLGGLNTIKNDEGGYLTINGGIFRNVTQFTVLNWHVATINNGIFESDGDTIVNAKYKETPILTINGGTFKYGTGYSVIGEFGGQYTIGTVYNKTGKNLTVPEKYEWNSENTLVEKAN